MRDDEEHYRKAEAIMSSVSQGKVTATCDPVVLAEVVWVLGSYYKIGKADICSAITPIVAADNAFMPDKSRYLLAL